MIGWDRENDTLNGAENMGVENDQDNHWQVRFDNRSFDEMKMVYGDESDNKIY